VRLKYLGAGTVSFVGFLLATACGSGGSAGSGPPSLDDDGVPDSYDDLAPPTEAVPGDPDAPVPPVTDGVPNNQDDRPPGVGASCDQFCTTILASDCLSPEDGQTVSVNECTVVCQQEILPEPCSRELLDASLCLFGFLSGDSCDFGEIPEDEAEELIAACYTPLMAYVDCAGLEDSGQTPDPPGEGTIDCTCSCACEYGCSGTVTTTCTASGAQACVLCDSACNSYCSDQECGASLVPPSTPASCVGQ
jgi:hypothetical protein